MLAGHSRGALVQVVLMMSVGGLTISSSTMHSHISDTPHYHITHSFTFRVGNGIFRFSEANSELKSTLGVTDKVVNSHVS